jgi:SAM-dependent methyltransferase
MKKVKSCQDEIVTLNPDPRYMKTYRGLEPLFWVNLPKWIKKDSYNHPAKKLLDIGCGFGTLALYCKRTLNCEVYATDFVDDFSTPHSLAKKYNWTFKVNNIELDDFPWDVKFDIILFTEVLEHFNFNPVPTLKKMHDLLSENGVLYLSTPDAAQWGRLTKYYPSLDKLPYPKKGLPVVDDHVYVYTKQEILQVLNEAGLKIQRFGYSPGLVSRHFNIALTRE